MAAETKPASNANAEPLILSVWEAQVHQQLTRILDSTSFDATTRGRRLLQYLTEETLAGRGALLKQYSIAVDVLGRSEDFNPVTDPVVRAEASKLRRAIEHYYLVAGSNDPVILTLPKGSYVMAIERRDAAMPADSRYVGTFEAGQRPRIAVLPFAHQSSILDAEVAATGLTEALITALSRFQEVDLVAHHSVRGYSAAREKDLQALREEFALDFIVSGRLRLSGGSLRLFVQMMDVQSGASVWTETFDREWSPAVAFETEDVICSAIVGQLAGQYGAITHVPENLVISSSNLSDVQHLAALTFYAYNVNPDLSELVRDRLQKAVDSDPDNPLTLSMLAEVETDVLIMRLGVARYELPELLSIAKRAAQLDPKNQQVLQALAYLYMQNKEYSLAVETGERCVALNPNAPYLVAFCGFIIALSGKWDRGIELLKWGTRLNPRHPAWMTLVPLLDAWRKGDYEAAYGEAQRFNTPALCWDPLLRAATLVRCDRIEDARRAVDELLQLDPEFPKHAEEYISRFVCDPTMANEIISSIFAAGLGS